MATVKKKLPYELYDVAGLEDWFTQMAAQGYHLEDYWQDKAKFTVGEPKHNVRYRLEAQQTYQYDWNKDREYAAQGWHHVTTIIGFFYIFQCDDPAIEELHTDPTIQSWTMKKLIRRQAFFFVWWPLYVLFMMRDTVGTLISTPYIFLMELVENTGMCMVYAVLLLSLVYLAGCQIVLVRALRKLQQRLASGLPMDRTRRYPRSFWRHGFMWVLAGLMVATFVITIKLETQGVRALDFPLEDYPHVTLEELLPGQVKYRGEALGFWTGQWMDKSLLAPVQMQFGDAGRWKQDESRVRVFLRYYETVSPTTARWVLKGDMQDHARGMDVERSWHENFPDEFSPIVLDTGPILSEYEGLDELWVWDYQYEDSELHRVYHARMGSNALVLYTTLPEPEKALDIMLEKMEESP